MTVGPNSEMKAGVLPTCSL
ncbi:hypothetical protein ID866_9304 [Astraeus odoratus]|nr:hypothetical protein ID866_9304 [Astraeus odoratus]